MKVLIVFAHPESQSFGGVLLRQSVETLQAADHEVVVSDLYAMNFNPVAGAADFSDRRFSDRLYYDREQKYAWEKQTVAADIQAEIDKIVWADFIIFQFPLWWFSTPAILKGWFDRVFVNGLAYGTGKRLDSGGLKGRSAMMVVSTGCYPDMVMPDGLLGDIEIQLWHLTHGTLAYTGLTVLPTFYAWSVQYTTPEQRAGYIEQYAERLKRLEDTTPIFFHPTADFGSDWRLKPEIVSRTVGQHRR